MKRNVKFSKVENKPLMRALQNLRRSSAAAPHILKRFKGTRTARKNAAIKDQLENC